MRGKDVAEDRVFPIFRITPAYAGKRRKLLLMWQTCRDHPRVCGEKLARLYSSVPVPGSPPHMQGKARHYGILSLCCGITPAYAGKRWCTSGRRSAAWDHPRICGEKPSQKGCGSCPAGLPPHMRGKEERAEMEKAARRITPAYAGKSTIFSTSARVSWDHPRVCGEKRPSQFPPRIMVISPRP